MEKSTTEKKSENSNKIDNGDAINTHTHLCPLYNFNCRKDRCAWWSFEYDECSIKALVMALDNLTEWERDRT